MEPAISIPGDVSEPGHICDISGWWHAATCMAPCSGQAEPLGTWGHKSSRPVGAISNAELPAVLVPWGAQGF